MSLEKSIDKFAKTSHDAMDAISTHAVESINKIGLIVEAQATPITELEAQLADAKQAARWESDLASQALADLATYRKDAERYQWLRRTAVELSLSHQVISQFVTNQGELDAAIQAEGKA